MTAPLRKRCSRLGSHWDRCGVHYVEPIEGTPTPFNPIPD
jgi:hypothetical protein